MYMKLVQWTRGYPGVQQHGGAILKKDLTIYLPIWLGFSNTNLVSGETGSPNDLWF